MARKPQLKSPWATPRQTASSAYLVWTFSLLWFAILPATFANGAGIHPAVREGDVVRVWELLQTQPEAVHALASSDRSTALHEAVRYDQIVIARMLLAAGADVNAKTKFGYTPLKLAKGHGRTELAALLADHGALLLEPPPKPRSRPVPWQQSTPQVASMPAFTKRLNGNKALRIVNNTRALIKARIIADSAGAEVLLAPGSTRSVSVPVGTCQLFYISSSAPSELYQGDDVYISPSTASVTIQLNASHGNYRIRRVN